MMLILRYKEMLLGKPVLIFEVLNHVKKQIEVISLK